MTCERETSFPLTSLLAGTVDDFNDSMSEIRGLCLDSRLVRPGDLFFALAGARSHGLQYATAAVESGANAILYDPAGGGSDLAGRKYPIPCIRMEQLSQQMGFIADRFYRGPSSKLRVVGITGTNGKTSSSHFLAQALSDGENAAVIGTLGWGVPGALQPTSHTTPDAVEVHSLLAKLLQKSIEHVAMESSSHGLEQGRLNGVSFEGCLFTNLSRDHLDYHVTMEDYLEAKLRLVTWPGLKFIAFNLDDNSAETVMARAPKALRKIGFTLTENYQAPRCVETVQALAIKHGQEGVSFDACFNGQKTSVSAPLLGGFNVENLAGVLAVLLAKGFNLQEAAERLKKVRPVPGRMERFSSAQGAAAVVDYAHTPDALEKALTCLRFHCRGLLWVVFGCGGDRDRGKRPQMGAIAERLADRVVLTDDNPRFEDGDSIIEEIITGCKRKDIIVNRDRRSAIAHALEKLGPEDIVLIAGKGHEDMQEISGVYHPFNDRQVVVQLLGQANERKALCA